MLAAGAVVVSAACADILRQFDLGHSSLYPIKLFQHDRGTPVEGEYFCLNIGERKDAFLPELSRGSRPSAPGNCSSDPICLMMTLPSVLPHSRAPTCG